MSKKLKQFIAICGAIFLFAPLFVFGQEASVKLKEGQVIDLLDIIRKYPLTDTQRDFYDQSLYYVDSDYPRKTGAVMLVKQTILQKQLDYWFIDKAVDFSKRLIVAVYKLLPLVAYGDFSGAIGLVEKYTVEQANKYINDWLAQNQTLIGAGVGKSEFLSFKSNWQVINIPYIIVYSPVGVNKAKIVVEFYSKTAIEPPESRGSAESNMDWVNKTSWPRDRWLINEKKGNNDGKIEPFIVRVKGQVIKDKNGLFSWDKTAGTPSVEVEFGKPVPEIDQSDVILKSLQENQSQGFLQDKINKIKQTAQGIVEQIKNLLTIFNPQAQISSFTEDLYEGSPRTEVVGGRPLQDSLQEVAQQSQEIVEQAEEIVTVENATSIQEDLLKTKAGLEQAIEEKQAELDEILLAQATSTNSTPQLCSGQACSSQENSKTICKIAANQEPALEKIIFNEIAWMGTTKSASDEWIELKNFSVNPVDLNGWQIFNKNQNLKIFFTTTTIVAPGGFLLLERTNDDTVANIKADLIYAGAIANTDEALYLADNNCILQDKAKASPYWLEGDNSTKKTMERNNFLGWQTSSVVGGTPKATNSYGETKSSWSSGGSGGGGATNNPSASTSAVSSVPNGSGQATSTATSTQQATSTQNATSTNSATTTQQATTTAQVLDIVINEIAWMGTQASANHEWIELYNNTDQEINLTGWKIVWSTTSISVASTSIYLTGKISSNSFYLLERTASTTISDIIEDQIYTGALSNSGEKMELKDSQGNVIDLVDCSSGWFAGDNSASTSRKTMERKSPIISDNSQTNWASNNIQIKNGSDSLGNLILGTPKAQNSVFATSSANSASSSQATTTQAADLPGIADLMAVPSPSRLAVDLFWTCPTSTASGYIIKMASQEITSSTWDTAQIISQNIAPKPALSVEHLLVDNLQGNAKYFFAIKYASANSVQATSLISDSVSATAWPGFVDNGDGTITDLRTSLIWQKDASSSINNFGASSTQFGAMSFIQQQSNGWRLANYKELASLFNYASSQPSAWSGFENIMPATSTGSAQATYWSKNQFMTYQAGFPGDVSRFVGWAFNFQTGAVVSEWFVGGNSSLYRFLATQGNEIPGGLGSGGNLDITNNTDGTIKDNRTGLMWLNNGFALSGSNAKNWQMAFQFANNAVLCNDSTLQGTASMTGDCSANGGVKYDDWRLANVQEMLESYGVLAWQNGVYWTANIFDDNNFWQVGNDYYSIGTVFHGDKNNPASVQLLREP